MKPELIKTPLDGPVIIDVHYFEDERGFFMEVWQKKDFAALGLDLEFCQENHSRSAYGVLRGLHYQDMTAPLGKLIRCTLGTIFDVVVDLRVSSPTFGKWFGLELSAANKKQFYIPPGFAHGFASLTEFVEVQYKQTGYYNPSAEQSIAWNDPDIDIDWPIKDPTLSNRDQKGISLQDYLKNPAFT